jgi:hypothetical protein
MKHGSPEKYDYSYKRNGTANIILLLLILEEVKETLWSQNGELKKTLQCTSNIS